MFLRPEHLAVHAIPRARRAQVQAWRLRKWWERRGEDETLRQLVERMIHHEVGTEIYGEDVR